jgi:subtilisin family serine protease
VLTAEEATRLGRRLEATHGIRVNGRSLQLGMLFARVDPATVDALVADSLVRSVSADVIMSLAEVSGPAPLALGAISETVADAIPWGVASVAAPSAWSAGITGAGIRVGIVDSGIDAAHPDLLVAGGYDFTTNSGNPSAFGDNLAGCNGHGTHIAGIIGARQNGSGLVGVAPGAQLYALKVFELINGSCASWASNQIAAIDWAVANGIRVLNVSVTSTVVLGAYQAAVSTAAAAGVLIVGAAGNASATTVAYPAAYTNVVAVGGLTAANGAAYFSNTGPELWLAAPGLSITSTAPGGGSAIKSGTSMAAAHVAGVAALLLQVHPTWTPSQVRAALQSGATDVGSPGWDPATGWGLVQAPSSGGGGSSQPLALAVSPGSRLVVAQEGGASSSSDQATVVLTGNGASATAWSATKRKAWITLNTASGSGSGTLSWSRDASGLAPGVYIDTLQVLASGASGSPARVIDTLLVTAAPIPLTLTVNPTSRRVTIGAGDPAPADSASVVLAGTNAWQVGWTASKRKSWTALVTAAGTGSGTLRWNRVASGLGAGTYVDTISVSAPGVPIVRVVDTLVVTAPQPLAVVVAPAATRGDAQAGTAGPRDSALVHLTGAGATSAGWTASRRQGWTVLLAAAGTGTGWLRWGRDASALATGTYVDTLTVTVPGAVGSPIRIIDTLRVVSDPIPLDISLTPGGRQVQVEAGAVAPATQVAVQISGTGASGVSWSTTKRQSWTTLLESSGVGNGVLRWVRTTAGLVPGIYVDTLTVTAPGATGSPATVFDTMVVVPSSTPPFSVAVVPAGRRTIAPPSFGTLSDGVDVVVSGAGSGSAIWAAEPSGSWTTIQTPGGVGSGQLRWQRSLVGLNPGRYIDTMTIISGLSAVKFMDTLDIVAPGPGPAGIVLARAGARRTQLRMGGQQTSVAADSVAIVALQNLPSGSAWLLRSNTTWLSMVAGSGAGTGIVRWTRNAGALGPGVHAGSFVVELATDPAVTVVYADTVVVEDVPSPTPAVAAEALFGNGALSLQQRTVFDAVGNQNGSFDLGDFLAWVDRNNIRLSAAVMSRLSAGSALPPPADESP